MQIINIFQWGTFASINRNKIPVVLGIKRDKNGIMIFMFLYLFVFANDLT